ncbi:rhodanese-like domain-containing protein [Urbifossiella limnaea]|uniref:Molybdopterin biosynthesis protein MoeB n=1 Tax=Urbifossiella limnaea TaxID=2528023 RepID=A0A517Y1Q8_9BACT|nr:rhodanese-like domain-containing protein [Urbifossiella limnaea]QDU23674.1 molybdopterin biosynthesis protein MoeB [Urbifossiella limnaea]
MKRLACAGVLAAFAFGGVLWAADHTTDSLDVVKTNVTAGKAVIVDVREAGEWGDGHLKGAKHVALSNLKAGVPAEKLRATLPPGSIVYLHCASGRRCLAAADLLKGKGYDVRPLRDGFDGLVKAGFEPAK